MHYQLNDYVPEHLQSTFLAGLQNLENLRARMETDKSKNSIDCSDGEEEDDKAQRTLFCGNLDDQVTEDLLLELFIHAGPIENISLPKNSSGHHKNFAFITYKRKITIDYALNIYCGLKLFGRLVTLQLRTSNESANNSMTIQPRRQSDIHNDYQLMMQHNRSGNNSKEDWVKGSRNLSSNNSHLVQRHQRNHMNASPYQRPDNDHRRHSDHYRPHQNKDMKQHQRHRHSRQ